MVNYTKKHLMHSSRTRCYLKKYQNSDSILTDTAHLIHHFQQLWNINNDPAAGHNMRQFALSMQLPQVSF